MATSEQRKHGLRGLTDFRFEVLVAPKALGLLYGLSWLLFLVVAAAMVYLGVQAITEHEPFGALYLAGLAAIVLAPVVMLVGVLLIRILLELVLLLVQIETNTSLFRLKPSRFR
jgi:hypothetical protein